MIKGLFGNQRRVSSDSDESAERILDKELNKPPWRMNIERIRRCVFLLHPDYIPGKAPGEAEVWERICQAKKKATVEKELQSKPRVHFKNALLVVLISTGLLILTGFTFDRIRWRLNLSINDGYMNLKSGVFTKSTRQTNQVLIPPAEDEFAELLRAYQVNHPFPAVLEGFKLVELVDDSDIYGGNGRDIWAMYESPNVNKGLAYGVTLPQNSGEGVEEVFQDIGAYYDKDYGSEVITDVYGDYTFYFLQNASYVTVVANLGDCLFEMSTPASMEEIRCNIEELYGDE